MHAHAQNIDAPTRLVGRDEALRREPDVKAADIVDSLTTGIVDSHSLMTYLQGDYEDRGGDIAFRAIASLQFPRTLRQLETYLGMTDPLRQYVPTYAHRVKP